jgi:hypothetical protein
MHLDPFLVKGFELFLLGFHEFSSERGMLETLHIYWGMVLLVVLITTFCPSVR